MLLPRCLACGDEGFRFSAIESDDPERLRLAIEETLSRLTDDSALTDNNSLLNLISQRKSVSTPDISNGEPTFTVSSTEQASSADNLTSASRATDQVVHVRHRAFPSIDVVPPASRSCKTSATRSLDNTTPSWHNRCLNPSHPKTFFRPCQPVSAILIIGLTSPSSRMTQLQRRKVLPCASRSQILRIPALQMKPTPKRKTAGPRRNQRRAALPNQVA